jgi:hypothetical protein
MIATLLLFAGEWNYETVTFSTEYTSNFDTIQADTTDTYDVGNGKKLPESYTLLYKLTPDTSTESDDSLHVIVYADYCNTTDFELINSVNLDTVDLDSATVSTENPQTNSVTVSNIPDFRYVRFRFSSTTVDTFTINSVEKSIEFE